MVEISTEGKSWIERWALIGLAGINVVVVPCVGWLVASDVRDTLEKTQTELARFELDSRRASEDLQQSIIVSNHITAKDAVVAAIERTIPSVEVTGNVEARSGYYLYIFEIKNASAITIICERPSVYLNRGAWKGKAAGEESIISKDSVPSYPGVMAPGASFRTTWSTPDMNSVYWANFSGSCRPMPFRKEAVADMAAQAGIDLGNTTFEFSFDRWYSTST